MRIRSRAVAWFTAALVAVPGVAAASWLGSGAGSGTAEADSIPSGPTPSIAVTGRNVVLAWSEVTFADASPLGAYVVARYPAGGGPAEAVLTACDAVIAGLTCTEGAVPPGDWRYAIRPVRDSWAGPEGPLSAVATVDAPTFAFDSGAPVLSLPAALTGSLAAYATGESVGFRLDAIDGPLLSGSTTPPTIPFSGSATTSTTIPAGTADGPHTVYAVGSGGSTASDTVLVDAGAPVVDEAVIGKASGGAVGSIRQGGAYYVYANIADAGSGVAAATADVSAITTGSTAVTLTAGSYTAGGVTFGYRSAAITASSPLAAGTKTFSVTATDANGHAGTTGGFTVTVDNTRPSGADVQTANGGAVAGMAETADTITYSFDEPIEPSSLLAGWDGTGTQTVTVRLQNLFTVDRIQIRNAANTATLPLGTIRLNGNHTSATRTFAGSSMTISGTTVTIVLGTPSGSTLVSTTPATMRWNPSTGATDLAGNACQTTSTFESGAADLEF